MRGRINEGAKSMKITAGEGSPCDVVTLGETMVLL